ncbi:MAG: hypothetical protein L0220_31910 [Acidobacteria bacterium]|nr:hypothetical protein [Acidobacteriota bacterium]
MDQLTSHRVGRLGRYGVIEMIDFGVRQQYQHSHWDRRPCRRLSTDFFYGLASGLAHGIFKDKRYVVAQRLHQELSVLLDELARQDRGEGAGDRVAEAYPAYTEFVQAGNEEFRVYEAEQECEWQELQDIDEDDDWDDYGVDWNDWDDHDLDWEHLHWNDD